MEKKPVVEIKEIRMKEIKTTYYTYKVKSVSLQELNNPTTYNNTFKTLKEAFNYIEKCQEQDLYYYGSICYKHEIECVENVKIKYARINENKINKD